VFISTIFVSKKDESFIQISAEDSVGYELSEYFSFYAPGYQYTPLFKNGMWDGKVRLYNRRYNTLPAGLIGYLQKFAADRQYNITIDDAVLITTNFSIAEADAFAKSLSLPHIPHDHQIEAFAKSIRNRRILVVSPTGSGKSLLMYMIVRYLQLSYKRGLVIVPTTSLVEQLFTDFISYGWNSNKYVHRMYAGKSKKIEHFLTISTWQTLHLQDPEYLKQFDFVLGDEAHNFKAKSLTDIMGGLTNAAVRVGTTGTLDGTKVHKLVLEGHFGPVFQAATTRQLMDEGKLADLKIKCLILKYPEETCKSLKKSTYAEEYEAVILSESRKKFIRNLVLSLKGNTLILFQLVRKHGGPMYDDIVAHTKDRNIFFVHGGVDTMDREDVRRITEESTDAVIVASYGTFSTGTNIKNIDNVILGAPSKARIRNLQSIGRGLRKTDTKNSVMLFDIVDDLRVGKHVNFLLKHFVERANIYNEEKFPFKQYMIDLK
jgi:superfamily II DNA or RNA helicase